MTNNRTGKAINLDLFKDLYGPPPVLRTENPEHYNQIFDHLINSFMPQDFLELTLLKHLVDAIWQIKRYTRHQTVFLERSFSSHVEAEAQIQLQRTRGEAKVNETLSRAPTEFDHNRAITNGIAIQMQLNRLIADSTARFNDTLVLFDHYSEGLGGRLRQASGQIIEAEYKEIKEPLARTPQLAHPETPPGPPVASADEAASIVPSEENTDDVAPENSGEQSK